MSQIGDDRGRGMFILPCSQQNKAGGKERGGGIYSCSRQWTIVDKPDEQRLSLLRLCHGEKTHFMNIWELFEWRTCKGLLEGEQSSGIEAMGRRLNLQINVRTGIMEHCDVNT